jgi:DNA repair protein RadD
VTLWPHQERLVTQAREEYAMGSRRMLLVLPTGGGKTRVASTLASGMLSNGWRVLFVAHLGELLEQARRQLPEQVVIESVQTMARRKNVQHFDAVITDEAHHASCATYRKVIDATQPTLHIGLTATPSRLDGTALGSVFDSLLVGATTSELVTKGILVPSRVIGSQPTPGTLAAHPVDAYRRYAPGGRALVYAASVEHAARLADLFTIAGYPSRSLDGKTRDRVEVNARFASGELRVLTTYRLVSEGYDVPDVGTVILASNMTSPAMLLQAVGRGKRCAPGKTHETVLDLAGVCIALGIHPDDDLEYSLEGKPITRAAERGEGLRSCDHCGMVFWAHEYRTSTCPECGHVRPGRPDPRVVKAELEEQRQDMFRKLALKAGEDEVEFLRDLLKESKEKNWKPRAVAMRYRARFGKWPSKQLMIRAGGE